MLHCILAARCASSVISLKSAVPPIVARKAGFPSFQIKISPALVDDEPATVASLAAQQRQIVKDQLDQAMLASLHSLRFIPDAASQWLAKSPFDGQRCSFVLSNPGPIGIERLAGCQVIDAFFALAAAPDPGLVVVGQRFGARMSVMLSWCDGLLSRDELVAQEPAFRRDLLGS